MKDTELLNTYRNWNKRPVNKAHMKRSQFTSNVPAGLTAQPHSHAILSLHGTSLWVCKTLDSSLSDIKTSTKLETLVGHNISEMKFAMPESFEINRKHLEDINECGVTDSVMYMSRNYSNRYWLCSAVLLPAEVSFIKEPCVLLTQSRQYIL